MGSVICVELARRGYSVAVHYRGGRDRAAAVAGALPVAVAHAWLGADLLDRAAAWRLVADAGRALGGPVTAVVDASWPAFVSGPIAELGASDVDAALAGVRAHLHLCAAAAPALRLTRGSLVFLGGALAHRRHPSLGLFSLTKAAAESATLTFALEEGHHGVRANVIAPGRVDIGGGDLAESDPAYASLDTIGALKRSLPLPTASDIARTVAYLVGPDSTAVTGQVIAVAGGEQW